MHPLRALRLAPAVAEHLNFRLAANALGVAQSSVSARIKTLEEDLGILRLSAISAVSGSPKPGACRIDGRRHRQFDYAAKTAGTLARDEEGCLRIGLHMTANRQLHRHPSRDYR